MKAGVPRPARSRPLLFLSVRERGGTAVLSGDGEGLHTRREAHLDPRNAPVMNKHTVLASDAETLLPDSFGAGYSSLRGLADRALTRGNVGFTPVPPPVFSQVTKPLVADPADTTRALGSPIRAGP